MMAINYNGHKQCFCCKLRSSVVCNVCRPIG